VNEFAPVPSRAVDARHAARFASVLHGRRHALNPMRRQVAADFTCHVFQWNACPFMPELPRPALENSQFLKNHFSFLSQFWFRLFYINLPIAEVKVNFSE
jgi:hypothetical protein